MGCHVIIETFRFQVNIMSDRAERTCYVSNLHEKVTQELLKELFIQVTFVKYSQYSI